MKSAPAIAFDYRPSRAVAAATLAIVVLAAFAPWASALPPAWRLVVSVAAAASGAFALRRMLRPAFRRVAWRPSGWVLVDRDGREHAALLESHARLGGLLALRYRHGPRARCRLVLAPDNLDADTRRRLVLLLARGDAVEAP